MAKSNLDSYSFRFLLTILALIVNQCVSYSSFPAKSSKSKDPSQLPKWIWISEDPVLKEILAEKFDRPGVIEDFTDLSNIASIELINIESEIPYASSIFLSLSTLSFGMFHEIKTKYDFEIHYLNDFENRQEKYTSYTEYRVRTIMPPYIGLATTLVLGITDRYKKPEHLREYCFQKEVSGTRETWEASREDYCKEYKRLLTIAWQSIETQVESDLKNNSKRK